MRWSSMVVLAGVLGGTARADVGQLVRDATNKVNAGDFVGAAAAFREAYRVEPNPNWICNAGVAYHKAGDRLAQAQLYLSICLERGKGALDRKFMELVTAALAQIDRAIEKGSFMPVDVAVTPATAAITIAAFGPEESFIGSRVVWLPWGEHAVTVRAAGHVEQTVPVKAAGRDRFPLRITLEPGRQAEPTPPAPRPPPPALQPKPPVSPRVAAERRSLVPPIAATSLTLVAFTASAVGFVGGHRRAELAELAVSPEVYQRDKNAVAKWNRLFAITGVVAVLGAGASGYLWYRALHPATHVEVAPVPAPGGGAVMLRGRF